MEKMKLNSSKAGMLIPAGIFIGFGYGFATHNIPAGMFGGLGLGFLGYALVMIFGKSE